MILGDDESSSETTREPNSEGCVWSPVSIGASTLLVAGRTYMPRANVIGQQLLEFEYP